MALSKLQKGLVGLGIAVVAVIAVGYGGMRYLENAVVDAIRTWAAQTPQDAHVELGDISYTLMDNHLVLKNVRMTYVTPAKQTVAATVETLDIRNPGTTLLSLMRDPKSEIKETELPVADEIALHNLSFGPEPNITVRLRTFKGVAIETAAVKTLMSTAGDDDPKVALAIIYGLSYKEDSASGAFFEIINNHSVTDSDIENFVEKNIKFSQIEAGYADEGLLPRLGILGQKFMGLTPEQCVDMAKKYVKESLGAAEGTENTAKLMEYIDTPGAIRLIFNTEKPIPVEAFDTLSDTDPSIKLDVNTGPKTALELMADLEKK